MNKNESVLNPNDRLMDKRGVAEMLDCSLRQVDALREKDGLPFMKLGGLVKFQREDVQRWLRTKMVNPPSSGEKGGRDE